MAELARHRFEARNMLKALAKDRKAAMSDIVGRYNYPELVAVRLEFIKMARERGMSCLTIGRVMGRHHTTILYHLNPEMKQRMNASAKVAVKASRKRAKEMTYG
jgi:chromosomal replication initiation ATPase DnaA